MSVRRSILVVIMLFFGAYTFVRSWKWAFERIKQNSHNENKWNRSSSSVYCIQCIYYTIYMYPVKSIETCRCDFCDFHIFCLHRRFLYTNDPKQNQFFSLVRLTGDCYCIQLLLHTVLLLYCEWIFWNACCF